MIFLLPNEPVLPDGCTHYQKCSVQALIDLNGNHWRKILTIIAKLCTNEAEDWRIVRDQCIWQRVTLIFNDNDLPKSDEWRFIVGKTFNLTHPIPNNAHTIVSGQHQASRSEKTVWTPYLDYRQFPNALIEALKQEMKDA